jgi:uncharacterized tellurite resistance protein B-like protein
MTPTELDNNKSKYDYDNHVPYPTITFIQSETGENLNILSGSELRAKAEIKQITDEFKQELFNMKLRETFNTIEYLVAFKKEWRHEFIKSIANVIYAEYNTQETRIDAIRRIINGSSLLSIDKFIRVKFDYRVGY